MARPSIECDSDLVNNQIQQEVETYASSNPSPQKKKRKRKRGNKMSEIDGVPRSGRKIKHSQDISDDEEHHRAMSPPNNKKPGNLDPDYDEGSGGDLRQKSVESSPSKKKRKRNRHMIELYEVDGVQNLPTKRKTSYRIAQNSVTETVRSEVNATPANAGHIKVTSYSGMGPFMSPPKVLVPPTAGDNSLPKSPQAQSAQQARLQSILKACSRNMNKNFDLDKTLALGQESDSSPSPPTIAPRVTIKVQHESPTVSHHAILKAYIGKDGRCPCPVEGCHKSYTRKDSLAGHIRTCHSEQILRDNGNKTYLVVTQTPEKGAASNLSDETSGSVIVLRASPRGLSVKSVKTSAAPEPTRNILKLRYDSNAAAQQTEEGIISGSDDDQGKANKRAKTLKKEEAAVVIKLRQQAGDISPSHRTEHSSPANTMLIDNEVDRDGSPSPIAVRTSMPPQSPKPIKPVVGNIALVEAQHGSTMEDWEVSPGIVKNLTNDINSRSGYEIAYSANYIRTNPAVTEFANTSFAIHTLSSGCSFGFPLENFVRVCYVVSGKVQVLVDGAAFCIGKGGMWRIIGLGSCVIGNQEYEDAIIHITSIRLERGRCV